MIVLKIRSGNSKVIRFGISDNEKLVKKLEKLFKFQKLFKSGKKQSKMRICSYLALKKLS